MGRYLVRRLLQIVPMLLGIGTLVFFLVHATPGGPVVALGGEFITADYKAVMQQMLDVLRSTYEPLIGANLKFLPAAMGGTAPTLAEATRLDDAEFAERQRNNCRTRMFNMARHLFQQQFDEGATDLEQHLQAVDLGCQRRRDGGALCLISMAGRAGVCLEKLLALFNERRRAIALCGRHGYRESCVNEMRRVI